MVTLCDLGITIKFFIGNTIINVTNMAESKNEYDNHELTKISFREYENVALMFESFSEDDKINYDGIDLLPIGICEVDDGVLYLKPQGNGNMYSIFEHSSEYYAMRVGKFELKLYHSGNVYYQWFEVLPKNIDQSEWVIMQKELEEEIQGLSSDIIRKNIFLGGDKNEIIPSKELYKFFVIKRHFTNILSALMDLKDKPNYRVQKAYRLEPLYQAVYIDNVTVKDYLMKGTGEEKYLVPKRIYNYDLPENRWLKKIIKGYEDELRLFIEATDRYIEVVENEIGELNKYQERNMAVIQAKKNILEDLSLYLKTAKTILGVSELIKNKEWYKQVGKVDSLIIPHVLIYDVRYNAFYKMHKELKNDNITIKWSENYSYSWKLSCKMYEIWCFIKICRFLISNELGFEANGWVFDELKRDHMLIPELLPNTKLEFKKNDFKIKIYYNNKISKSIDYTDKENNPIFATSKHVQPDIRLDLYKNDIFWSSLIFEVKYRTVRNFWNSNDSSCKDQIIAYKDRFKSKYCRGLDPDFAVRKINPVDRVWILHPTHSSKNIIDKQNEGIKFVQLIPGKDHSDILKELRDEIDLAFDGLLI